MMWRFCTGCSGGFIGDVEVCKWCGGFVDVLWMMWRWDEGFVDDEEVLWRWGYLTSPCARLQWCDEGIVDDTEVLFKCGGIVGVWWRFCDHMEVLWQCYEGLMDHREVLWQCYGGFVDHVEDLWTCGRYTTPLFLHLWDLQPFHCLCSPMTLVLALRTVMHACPSCRLSGQLRQPIFLSLTFDHTPQYWVFTTGAFLTKILNFRTKLD